MTDQKDFYQISLKLILKNDKGEILALGGHPSGSYAGYHDLPGGRIDVSEFKTPYEEILKREIQEELGEDIQVHIKPIPVAIGRHAVDQKVPDNEYKKEVHIFYIFFEAHALKGDIKKSDEHTSIKWITLSPETLERYFISGIKEGLYMYVTTTSH
jgi:8-oxo-dGTP pyrophosphatase MutT (NUDIX family)